MEEDIAIVYFAFRFQFKTLVYAMQRIEWMLRMSLFLFLYIRFFLRVFCRSFSISPISMKHYLYSAYKIPQDKDDSSSKWFVRIKHDVFDSKETAGCITVFAKESASAFEGLTMIGWLLLELLWLFEQGNRIKNWMVKVVQCYLRCFTFLEWHS